MKGWWVVSNYESDASRVRHLHRASQHAHDVFPPEIARTLSARLWTTPNRSATRLADEILAMVEVVMAREAD